MGSSRRCVRCPAFPAEDDLTKLLQVASVDDVTQKDLLAIQSSGAHSDEKLLAELRKRKLIEKKCVHQRLFLRCCSLTRLARALQEDVLLLCREGAELRDNSRQAGDGLDGGVAELVRGPPSSTNIVILT